MFSPTLYCLISYVLIFLKYTVILAQSSYLIVGTKELNENHTLYIYIIKVQPSECLDIFSLGPISFSEERIPGREVLSDNTARELTFRVQIFT